MFSFITCNSCLEAIKKWRHTMLNVVKNNSDKERMTTVSPFLLLLLYMFKSNKPQIRN